MPRESVEIQPGGTPVPNGGERVKLILGGVGATLKDVSDELQGTAHPEAAESIRAFRGRLLALLEAEQMQLFMMGALGVNVFFLMLELLTDCHIAEGPRDPTCFDGLLHSLSMIIVLVFAVETLLLVYCLRAAYFANKLYFADLVCVTWALVMGILGDTDAFSLLLLSRSWRVANFVARSMGLQNDLTELVEREVSAATRDLEAANQQLSAEKTMLVNRVGEIYIYVFALLFVVTFSATSRAAFGAFRRLSSSFFCQHLADALERSMLDAEPVIGGGAIAGGGKRVSSPRRSPARARQPLV